MSIGNEEIPTQTIREQMVETAVKFLTNSNVQKTSLAEQQKFLRRKGLTDNEIQLACERSGAYIYQQKNLPPPLPVMHNYPVVQMRLFDKIREIMHNVAVFSFVAYAIYKFYEKFVAPFLFGKKKKSIEDSLEDLDNNIKASINDLQDSLTTVKVEIDKISQGAESSTQRQLSDLKSEISTVKGLLLSRNQFPSVRQSIPTWQKTSRDSDPDSDPERKDLEVCSGSGSEHNTQKSDSSLDIISYSSKDSDFHRVKSKDFEDEDDDK